MSICKHGTDLDDSDCINCENESDLTRNAAEKIHDLCLNCEGGTVPGISVIQEVIDKVVDELMEAHQ